MKPLLLAALLALVASFGLSQTANAHTLIKSDDDKLGAVFHIKPSDTPVAGQPATIFFDVQDEGDTTNARLEIASPTGNFRVVKATVNTMPLEFNYTFSQSGVHQLKFTAQIAGKTRVFTANQTVLEATGEVSTNQATIWPIIGLSASGAGFTVLATLLVVNWRKIWQNSSF